MVLPAAALVGIILGLVMLPVGRELANGIWLVALIATGLGVVRGTVRKALRGQWASDIIATLAIVAAAIMGQPLAGLIVVVMQTGGEWLERYAEGRASDAVRALEADSPRVAHAHRAGDYCDVAVESVGIDEVLLVRPGELVPCDGVVTDGRSAVDTSRVTGEPVPRAVAPGTAVQSGAVNGDRAFSMRVTATASTSQYARIVELVRTAQASKAPFQRLADRYAVWFTPLTLLVAGAAALAARDPSRMLAVLVVATPCPLILAPPIAIIGGMNRAARRQIIMRNGGAVERLDTLDTAVLDKTGTLTVGKPAVRDVVTRTPFTRAGVLGLAASVEQGASHLLARTLVDAARAEGVSFLPARDVTESPGRGVSGDVGGNRVAVGSRGFSAQQIDADARAQFLAEPVLDGLNAYVVVNGRIAATVAYADALRNGVAGVLARMKSLGIVRILLLSGDADRNARTLATSLGITEVRGDLRPEDKVATVRALVAGGLRVLMIGDGTNDAPALSAATIGIALAGHGGGVSAEAADVVLLVDDLTRVVEALIISRRTMRIARQSVWAGIGLSGIAMGVAALGHITPIAGALLQEAIDVGVILNALRASAGPRGAWRTHRSSVESERGVARAPQRSLTGRASSTARPREGVCADTVVPVASTQRENAARMRWR